MTASSIYPKLNVQSSNDSAFETNKPLKPDDKVIGFINSMIGIDKDLPSRPAVLTGLKVALNALHKYMPGSDSAFNKYDEALSSLISQKPLNVGEAVAAATVEFSRRRGQYQHYLALVSLGISSNGVLATGCPTDSSTAALIGAWSMANALGCKLGTTIARSRVTKVLTQPMGKASRAWDSESRAKAAGDAVYNLNKLLDKNQDAAVAMGLTVRPTEKASPIDKIEVFNTRFRRRWANLMDYKSTDSQAAAGGHGTLSKAALKSAGKELMLGMRAGDPKTLHIGIEIISHLTSEQVQLLPVQLGSTPPARAHAWLDIPNGAYCYTLIKLQEKGKQPEPGTETLYEPASQVVKVALSPPIATALKKFALIDNGASINVADLLGKVSHGPHERVAGTGQYRFTCSKIQATLPTLLIQEGEYRWPVALVTSAPFVVARGRQAYGVCRQEAIDKTTSHAYALLGWPNPSTGTSGTLIGSRVTPRSLTIINAFNALANDADSYSLANAAFEDVVDFINSHAIYLSMLLALTFALRDRVVYPLPTHQLLAGSDLKFCDKDIHDVSMPSIPILPFVEVALKGWQHLLQSAVLELTRINTRESMELASTINGRMKDKTSVGWVFTINSAGDLDAAGSHTWHSKLPASLKLVKNFGRQFWPLKLADRDIPQLLVDVLMRHQMPVLHPGHTHRVRNEELEKSRLVSAMSQVLLNELALPVPLALQEAGIDGK